MSRGGVLLAVALTLVFSPAAAAGQTAPKPDLMIVGRDGVALTGDDIYANGAGQQRSVIVQRRITLFVRIQNDGAAPGDVGLIVLDVGITGSQRPEFGVRYRLGRTDVTDRIPQEAQINSDRQVQLKHFAPGDERELKIVITARPSAPLGANLELAVKAAGTTRFDGDSVYFTITKVSNPE